MAERTVYVVDDDEGVRDALAMLLRTSGLNVETFTSAVQFLQRRPDCLPPCCLVLDLCMPVLSGSALQDELLERGVRIPIVFITGHGDVPLAVQAIRKGAYDFIQKPLDPFQLLCQVLNALEDSARGPGAAPVAASNAQRLTLLTERERAVLERVLEGKSSRQIGESLFISGKTVEFHRARIMQKLGVKTAAELFRRCLT